MEGKVPKQKAIELLKKRIEELNSIPLKRTKDDDMSEFNAWKKKTIFTLQDIFSEDRYTEFLKIRYSLSAFSQNTPYTEFINAHNNGRKDAKKLLEAYIQNIEEFWEDDLSSSTDKIKQMTKQKLNRECKLKNIFISHITEEKEVAIILKNLIEEIFPGQIEIFVSSDGESIIAGAKWLDEISKALDKADLLITLCSEMSIKRPWINFELGAGWIKNIPTIPICHLNMTKKQLPQPIAMLQSMDLSDDSSLKYMFESIAKHLELTLGKRIDFKCMMDEIEESFEKVKYKELPIKEESKKIDNLLDEEFYGKKDFCINILKLFMNEDKSFTTKEVKNLLSCNEQLAQFYLDKLADDNFLDIEHVPMIGFIYLLSTKGREYLIKSGIIS